MDESRPGENNASSSRSRSRSTFTCGICFESLSSNKKFRQKGGCEHDFCMDCMVNYIKAKVEGENTANLKCPNPDCDKFLSPLECKALISQKLFIEWSDCICNSFVLNFPRCYCPNNNCSTLIIDECKTRPTRSLCPNCKRLFCFNCQVPWHAGFKCSEIGQYRDEVDFEFGRIVEESMWARCPRCGHVIERTHGCDTVRCRCGQLFCYKCGRLPHPGACSPPYEEEDRTFYENEDRTSFNCYGHFGMLVALAIYWCIFAFIKSID